MKLELEVKSAIQGPGAPGTLINATTADEINELRFLSPKGFAVGDKLSVRVKKVKK